MDIDLFAYDLLLLAHSWALEYVRKQTAFALNAAIQPTFRDDYDIFSKGETSTNCWIKSNTRAQRQGYSFVIRR